MSFTDRNIVVTGGTGALGSAVVEALVEEGAVCHIPCFSASELDRFTLKDHDRVRITEGVDLREEAAVRAFYDGVTDLWASVQIAGGFAMASIEKTSGADFRKMFEMNAMTCFLACREAVRKMRTADGPQRGRIVNVAARPALTPTPGMIAYTVSKAAVVAITGNLAREVLADGILVNAVAPSTIDTPANRAAMPDADFDAWVPPEELARAILFLASPNNTKMSGEVLPVYGRA